MNISQEELIKFYEGRFDTLMKFHTKLILEDENLSPENKRRLVNKIERIINVAHEPEEAEPYLDVITRKVKEDMEKDHE